MEISLKINVAYSLLQIKGINYHIYIYNTALLKVKQTKTKKSWATE